MLHFRTLHRLVIYLTVLTLLLVVCPLAVDAQYKPVEWTTVDKPGAKGYIIVSPSEVNRIAVGNNGVVYAIDSANGKLYRSSNGGLSWSDITSSLPPDPGILPLTEIACSASDPKYVAVVTSGRMKVYFSDDNGSTWAQSSPAFPGTDLIQCIAISPGYLGTGSQWYYDVAIGTASWGDGTTNGRLLLSQIGGIVPSWNDQLLNIAGFTPDISAVAFSPNYKSDSVIFTTASGAASTFLCIGQTHQGVPNPTLWDTTREIANASDILLDPATIISSLSVPSDYDNTNLNNRKRIFVSFNRQPPAAPPNLNGVYRFDDTVRYAFANNPIDLSSIAYSARTVNNVRYDQLIAGLSAPSGPFTVQVLHTSTPFAASPPPSLLEATTPPSGPGNAMVAWSTDGSIAYCATGQIPGVALDESAFSRSDDNGDNWQQTSLMDTTIRATDIAVEPDSRSLFLATYSPAGPEGIWRTTAEPLGNFWGRVLSLSTGSDRLILRISPNYVDDYTLYAAEAEGTANKVYRLAVSHTRGNRWQYRLIPGPVADVAVAGRDALYVGLLGNFSASVRKSVNGGMMWQDPVTTGLDSINMLSLTKNGHLLVGGRDGKVAYSADEGKNFIVIPKPVTNILITDILHVNSDVQVVADANYEKNSTIYAAINDPDPSKGDKGTWRWIIGYSSEWEQVDKIITDRNTGERFSGLKVGTEGTLYALRSEQVVSDHTKGGMNRSLNPTGSPLVSIEWDVINRTLYQLPYLWPLPPTPLKPFPEFNPVHQPITLYSHTIPWLKISGNANENQLWSLHPIFEGPGGTYSDFTIFRFADTLCKAGPATKATGDIGCDPVSGRSQEVNFTWEQLSVANAYELKISKDRDFTQMVHDSGIFYLEPPTLMSPAYIYFTAMGNAMFNFSGINPCDLSAWATNPQIPLECGHLYYWKVRVRNETSCETVRSPWSAPKSFTVKAGFRVTTPYYGPQLLAPDNGCSCPCGAPLAFSWSPFKETARYMFELSANSDMSNPLVSRTVATTAYQYTGTLNCNRNYFWRVRGAEPSPSEWSAVFTFKTGAEAPVQQRPADQTAETGTPYWVWGIIGCGTGLWICLLFMTIERTRRR